MTVDLRGVFKIREGRRDDKKHAEALDKTGFWGKRAAGCLFYAQDTGRLLVAHRSAAVQEPGTWGTWGGAIDEGEDAAEAVRREIAEEAGVGMHVDLTPIWTFRHPSGFSYENFLAVVPHEFEPHTDHETQGHEWVEFGEWPSPLHPGLRALTRRPELTTAIERLGGQGK
jgi:8-oxo-dGTP pyrophosphatase MutT (NUDIX family)